MQKLRIECVSWLNWKTAVVLGVVLIGVMLYIERASWGLWLSATPLLVIAVCLLPCLLPLAFLWNKRGESNATQTKENRKEQTA
jgi:hypothetical protein